MAHFLRTGNNIFTSGNNIFVAKDAGQGYGLTVTASGLNRPAGVAFDVANNRYFIAQDGNVGVKVYNSTTHALITTITTVQNSCQLVLDSANGKLYCAGERASIHVVSLSTLAIIDSITPPQTCPGIALDLTNNRLYAGSAIGNVYYIDLTTKVVTHTIGGFSPIYGLALDPRGNNRLIVPGYTSSFLSIVNTVTNAVTTVVSASSILGLCFDPRTSNNTILIVERGANRLAIINSDTLAVKGYINGLTGPFGIQVDPVLANDRILVANDSGGNVVEIKES